MGQVLGRNPSTVYAATEGQKFAGDSTLVVVECCVCGVTFAIPESFDRSARKYHGDSPNGWSICCPFGHTWHYTGETDLERERRLRRAADERAQARQDLLEHEQRSHAATRGHLTRSKRRVAAGVCPVKGCRRHFKNLEAHMRTKHPSAVEAAVKAKA